MPHDTPNARLAIFDHRRGWQLGLLGASVTLMLSAIFVIGGIVELFDSENRSIGVDFYVFWAAAKLALQGLPLEAFDMARLQATAGVVDEDWMPWAYPAGFLMLLMPLGLLPFGLAWATFNALGIAALLSAVRPFTADRLQVLLATALAPAMLPCLLVGQSTLLWLAGLIGALTALRVHRPVLAGVLIGLLTLKPQLGLLIPIALIAAGHWRTLFAAAVTMLLLAAGPTLLFGAAYWPEMLATMELHGDTLRERIGELNLMISAYSALVEFGMNEGYALGFQVALAAACALAVFLTWRSKQASFDLRAAVLLTAIPLSSPYLWYYESALLAPAALFMWRAGILTPRPAGLILGLAMWLGLGPSSLITLKTSDPIEAFRPFFAPIALIAFAAVLRHALWRPGPAPAASSDHAN